MRGRSGTRADGLAREKAVLVERGYDVRVVTPVPFYRGLADLLDPGFVDVAAAAGANQAHDIAVDLRTRWS